MPLSREDVLSFDDRKLERVDVPEWGGEIFLRVMTGAERDSFEQSLLGAKGKEVNMENMRAKLLVKTICNEKGERLFADRDVTVLGGKSAAVLTRLFEIAQKINAMGAKEIEEKEKNSESEENDTSRSASQEN